MWKRVRQVSSVVDGHNSRVFAATFHPVQTTEFISGGWDSVVHVWDMRQTNSLRYIKGVHICGEGLDFSKSGREVQYLLHSIVQSFNIEKCSSCLNRLLTVKIKKVTLSLQTCTIVNLIISYMYLFIFLV